MGGFGRGEGIPGHSVVWRLPIARSGRYSALHSVAEQDLFITWVGMIKKADNSGIC